MDTSGDGRLTQSAAIFSMCVAACLILMKGFAWLDSDSSSVLASFADSSLDIIVSLINFFAIRLAFAPADKEHPFGHGKAESLAALMQSAFISGSAFVLLLHAGERMVNPKELVAWEGAIWVMAVSLILTLILIAYQRWVYLRTGSLAVKADSAHYVSDVLANIAVIFALIGASSGLFWLDPLIAGVIVIALLHSAYGIGKEALNMLMDHALDPEVELFVKQLVADNDMFLGCHDIKTRQSGNVQFIQLHLDFNNDCLLIDAHEEGEKLVADILKKYPRADVLIHHDPIH
ncbi:MAG TPA: divalent metal cation transporter FieF [Oceanospirillales bacterium]|jgi:ferrous-iron efflux pump FieF|nr:divalent metal cation transporter FieF [Oleispira sp.]HCM06627.1 divalent metal cation transporter FieF [Oceanospirillales bacterium]|tara:strand:- start:1016 stop:1885 length:870 start_codon:yes stop_codon:yes gene_type:complete